MIRNLAMNPVEDEKALLEFLKNGRALTLSFTTTWVCNHQGLRMAELGAQPSRPRCTQDSALARFSAQGVAAYSSS
ncbi:MAG TPA: hypothetical protein VHP35_19380 [Terriglobia bacterium]|nr:hypothetical protein [Terriglobia bacterium]